MASVVTGVDAREPRWAPHRARPALVEVIVLRAGRAVVPTIAR